MQETDHNQRPEPKVPGGATVGFKQGEPTRIELTVRHLVDGWEEHHYVFRMNCGVATLRSITPPGDAYHVIEAREALQYAVETVKEIPIVDSVEAKL